MNTQPARATRPLALDFSEVEDTSAAPVAEVIVSYAGTMLDVKHVAPRAKRSNDRAAVLVGIGAATLVAGLALFTHEVAQDWDSHRAAELAAAEEGRSAPEEPGLGLGGWGLLGLLGLVPLAIGLARFTDRRPAAYTVGEREDATFHTVLDGATGDAVLPLVAGGRLGFVAGMTGEIATAGSHYRLHDLIDNGRARADGAFFSVPLPADARCRLEYGPFTFHINAVAPGKVVAGRVQSDKAFWASNGVSLVLLGGLLALAHLAMVDADALALDDTIAVNRYVGYISRPDEIENDLDGRPDGDDVGTSELLAGTVEGQRAAGEPGKMGDPTAKTSNRRAAIERRIAAPPRLARSFDPIESAERAGILGQIHADPENYFAQAGGAFSVGADDRDVWANVDGTEVGSAHGGLASGLVGSGRGGGGDGDGTIGLGDMGLLGQGRIGEDGDGVRRATGIDYDHGSGTRLNERSRRVPAVRIAKASVKCGISASCLDKEMIRRVVRSHINEVRHCYNQGLVRDPNLRGRVSVQFRVDGRGSVQASVVAESTLDDANVGRCIAGAVKRWRFPGGPGPSGSAIVTYPFVLTPG